jgi:hypothetical protein
MSMTISKTSLASTTPDQEISKIKVKRSNKSSRRQ